MTALDDYCELCELPRSQCVHGMPPEPKAAPKPPPKPRKRAAAASKAPEVAKKTVSRRWTTPEALKPLVLDVLRDAGGELEADELFRELEAAASDVLRPADSERTPEGEPRWQYAARRARMALIDEGLMTKGVPGVWTLAESGRPA